LWFALALIVGHQIVPDTTLLIGWFIIVSAAVCVGGLMMALGFRGAWSFCVVACAANMVSYLIILEFPNILPEVTQDDTFAFWIVAVISELKI
jgi:hypothetical protein